MSSHINPAEPKTILMLSPAATSWALPLVAIFIFSLHGSLGVNLLLAFALVMASFIIGTIYGISGIKRFRENRKVSTLVQSIIGLFINLSFFVLLIAVSIPGYLKAMAAN